MPKRKAASRQVKPGGRPEPKPSRPEMPKGYGMRPPPSEKGFLPRSWLDQRMSKARNYWIGTTWPDGRPHIMPVWGVWVGGTFHFSTDRNTRKARNLAANPSIVVHLESGDDVVVLEGVAKEVRDRSHLKPIDDAYFAKYRMHVIGHPGEVVFYAVQPRVAFAWRERDFPRSATRWRLGGR